MKREAHKLKAKPAKKRKTWLINPRVRVHQQKGYQRSKAKRGLKREAANED
jgi:hypothetical protein